MKIKKYYYTYWLTLNNGLFYIGYRVSKVKPELDNYYGSSKFFSKKDVADKLILKEFPTRLQAIQDEINWHKHFDVKNNTLFANRANQGVFGFSSSLRGKDNPMYGVKHSDETLKKLSKASTGLRNGMADHDTYYIYNLQTGELLSGTRYFFVTKFGTRNIRSLLSGKIFKYRNFVLAGTNYLDNNLIIKAKKKILDGKIGRNVKTHSNKRDKTAHQAKSGSPEHYRKIVENRRSYKGDENPRACPYIYSFTNVETGEIVCGTNSQLRQIIGIKCKHKIVHSTSMNTKLPYPYRRNFCLIMNKGKPITNKWKGLWNQQSLHH